MNKTEANVLLCVTGSVAAIKALELAKVIKALGCVNIRIVLTEMAKHYFAPMDQLQSEFAVGRKIVAKSDVKGDTSRCTLMLTSGVVGVAAEIRSSMLNSSTGPISWSLPLPTASPSANCLLDTVTASSRASSWLGETTNRS